MSARRQSSRVGMTASPTLYIPVAGLLLVGLIALLAGLVSSIWVGATLLVIAVCVSIVVGYWASKRGDALVVALALLLFWLPFHTTASRFNLSPQELATYGIFIVAALFGRRGLRKWLSDFAASTPVIARFAIVLFVLAVLQSFMRISHPSVLGFISDMRAMVLYPILLALLIAYAIRTRKCEGTLVTAFFWGGVLLALYALTLRAWGVGVANGAVEGRLGAEASFLSDYHPNNLSLYFALALAFTPALLLSARRQTVTRFAQFVEVAGILGGAVLMLTALWLTFSRGALAALALSVVLALVFFVLFGKTRQRLLSAAVLFVGVAGVGGYVALKGVNELGRYAGLFNPTALSSDPDVTFRAQLFQRAVNLATEHPYTGIGLGQFSSGALVPFSPHNTYLDLWVSIGLVGVVAYVATLLLGIFSAAHTARGFLKSRSVAEMAVMLGFASALITFTLQAFVETFDVEPRVAPVAWIFALAAQAVWFRVAESQRVPVPTSERGAAGAQGVIEPEMPSQPHQADDEEEEESLIGRPGRVTVVLPAIERPWGLETGPMPIIENPNDSATDFHLPAIRLWAVPSRAQLKQPVADPLTAQPGSKAGESGVAGASISKEQQTKTAESMLQRAPTSYLWNQLYALWFFAVNFVLSVIITRGLSPKDYGVYSILSTIVGMLLFLFAFGFEDVATVFLPRVMAQYGQGEAGRLVRRLIVMRVVAIGAVGAVLAVGLPTAVPAMQSVGVLPQHFEESVRGFMGLRPLLMGAFLAGNSLVTLETAFFGAVLRSRVTLIVGGLSQLAMVLLIFPLLKLGYGIDSIFGVQAVISWVTAVVYLFALLPLVRSRSRQHFAEGRELRKLMFGAWLTNVTNGALGKQMDIMLMSFFALSTVVIGYYNLAYQLTTIVGVLLISGLGGVGMAAMSAALAAGGRQRLASMWRAALMLQLLLSVPLQIVCFVLADQIVVVLYKPEYAGAVPLLRIYLLFTIIGRFIGGGAHQSALYVIGRQRAVLIARWGGLLINVLLDIIFIQLYGPAGALFATGFSQLWVGIMEYLVLRARVPVSYPLDFAIRVLCISGLPAIVLLWWAPHGLFGLAARGIVFTVLFIVGLVTFKLGDANDLTDMINANPKLRKLVLLVNRRLPGGSSKRGQSAVAVE